jgi:hypothetical protein
MTILKAVLGLLFVGIVLTGLLLLYYFPSVPSSLTGWVVFVVVGIPLYVLLEALGEALVNERLFSERIGRRIFGLAGHQRVPTPILQSLVGLEGADLLTRPHPNPILLRYEFLSYPSRYLILHVPKRP